MDFSKLPKYIPAATSIIGSLGEAQKKWLDNNVDALAPFIQSEKGREALLLFLSELNDFVIAAAAMPAKE